MKKKIVFVSIILLSFILVQPALGLEDDSKIKGQITDEIEKPIENQKINLKILENNEFVSKDSALTNQNGEFFFNVSDKNKTYLLEFSYQGRNYNKIINFPIEKDVKFKVTEISDKEIIKGKIRGIEEADIILLKNGEKVERKWISSNYYKFTNLSKNTEYVIRLIKENISYDKSVKTDNNPTTSEIANFDFISNLSINFNILGDSEEEIQETKLFYENQVVKSTDEEEEVNFSNLLRNVSYRVEVSFNEGRYVKNYLTGSEEERTINLYGNGELLIEESEIQINVLNDTSPNFVVKESFKFNRTHFFLNNSIINSKENYSLVAGDLSFSLPRKEIIETKVTLLKNSSEFTIRENDLRIGFSDLKIEEDEEITLNLSYSLKEEYDNFLSREIIYLKEFYHSIEETKISLEVNQSEKHNLEESIKSDFNITKEDNIFLLSNKGDSNSFEVKIQWSTISDVQLLLYGGVILFIGLLITYSIFIALIGREKGIKNDSGDEKEVMDKAVQTALKKLKERYENNEITEEEFEKKKEKYKKLGGKK